MTVRFRAEEKDGFYPKSVQTGSGAHLVSCSSGSTSLPHSVKWPKREADQSPTSSTENNAWSYTLPPSCLHDSDNKTYLDFYCTELTTANSTYNIYVLYLSLVTAQWNLADTHTRYYVLRRTLIRGQ